MDSFNVALASFEAETRKEMRLLLQAQKPFRVAVVLLLNVCVAFIFIFTNVFLPFIFRFVSWKHAFPAVHIQTTLWLLQQLHNIPDSPRKTLCILLSLRARCNDCAPMSMQQRQQICSPGDSNCRRVPRHPAATQRHLSPSLFWRRFQTLLQQQQLYLFHRLALMSAPRSALIKGLVRRLQRK